MTCASDSRGNKTGITSLLWMRSGQIPVSVRPLRKWMICRLVCSITCKTLDASQPDFWTITITIHRFHQRTNVNIDLSVFVVIVVEFNTEKSEKVMQKKNPNKSSITACKSSFLASHFLLLLLGEGKSHDRQRWWIEASSFNSASPSSWNKKKCKENLIIYVLILQRVKWKQAFLFLLTLSTISRMSRSGQSLIVTGAVSAKPPKRTWIMAGLSPGKLGPLCKKEWPIILPAMVNMLFSSSSTDTEGMRWSGSPSNTLMVAMLPAAVMVFRLKIHPDPFDPFVFSELCRAHAHTQVFFVFYLNLFGVH